jgi:hypothetical protein
MTAKCKHQVFVSSTKEDLSDDREAVTWELLKGGFIPVGMENFSAMSDRGWKVIARTIDDSDYYVVIVAGRYGSIDTETGKSWTQREYEYAREKGLDVFAFIRDQASVAGNQVDRDEKAGLLDAFKATLRGAHLCEPWTTKDDLRARVATALAKAVSSGAAEGKQRAGWYRGPAPSLDEFSALSGEVRDLRARLAERPQNKVLELLKGLTPGTVVFIGGGTNLRGSFQFVAVDEAKNVVTVKGELGIQTYTFPLDKLDTIYPLGNGAYRVSFRHYA